MNQEMTERIAETKELVNAAEWREKILSCQESGKTVTAWCKENGISPSTNYRKLCMMREEIMYHKSVRNARSVSAESDLSEVPGLRRGG